METKRKQKFEDKIVDAYKEIAAIKWRQDFVCTKCGFNEYFEGKFPFSRRCLNCKKDFSPTAGTIFHGVRFPLHVALYIIKRLAAQKERISSEKLTEELSTKFKQKLRQKTIWAFLMKVYSAMVFPIPEFALNVILIRFHHGGKTILGLRGYARGKLMVASFAVDGNSDKFYENKVMPYQEGHINFRAFDAVFKKTSWTRLRMREWDMDVTLTSIINEESWKYDDRDFALTLYNAIVGVSSQHRQAYLNFYCFSSNGYSYDQLMDILIPKT